MEAARITKQRGHHVTLLEKSNRLGGNVLAAAVPTFKRDLAALLDWYNNEMRRLDIDVRLNVEATPGSLSKFRRDALVIAAGGDYFVPEIEGIKNKNVIKASDILSGTKEIGSRIIIIGAGLIGTETALHINNISPNKEITLLEVLAEPLTDVVRVNKLGLIEKLQKTNIKIITSAKIQCIGKEEVEYLDHQDKLHKILADSVILAAGFIAKTELARIFEGVAPEIYPVGDCRRPGKIFDAINYAALVASRI